MATEIAVLPLIKGYTPDDATSSGGQCWKDTVDVLTEQEGFQRCYWGRAVEDGTSLRLFVDWDSVDSHTKFTKSDAYGPFVDRLAFMVDMKKAVLTHVNYTPHPASAALSDLSSPTTEILSVFFPSSYSDSDKSTFETNIKKLVKAIEDNAKTYRGSAGGWVHEEVSIPDSSDKGVVYNLVIGWDSVQAHEDFRTTNAFKENIHNLTEAKDLKSYNVVHASLKEVQRGGAGGGTADVTDTATSDGTLNPGGPEKVSVKTAADGTTTKNDGGAANSNKKERQGRGVDSFA